jgi:hypothetical protein
MSLHQTSIVSSCQLWFDASACAVNVLHNAAVIACSSVVRVTANCIVGGPSTMRGTRRTSERVHVSCSFMYTLYRLSFGCIEVPTTRASDIVCECRVGLMGMETTPQPSELGKTDSCGHSHRE